MIVVQICHEQCVQSREVPCDALTRTGTKRFSSYTTLRAGGVCASGSYCSVFFFCAEDSSYYCKRTIFAQSFMHVFYPGLRAQIARIALQVSSSLDSIILFYRCIIEMINHDQFIYFLDDHAILRYTGSSTLERVTPTYKLHKK